MSSPFTYEDPLEPPEALAGRTVEMALLRDGIAETRNSRLEGPRRYGKTSLLKAVLARADKDGFVPIYVNFLGVLSAADVAERIERAYREQLDGPLKRWFSGVVSTLRPRVKMAPVGVGVEMAPEAQVPGLLDRLMLPRRLQERHGRQCAIAFDEFQDVVRVGDALTGTIRSELEQHGNVAAYVFSGSHPGLTWDSWNNSERRLMAVISERTTPLQGRVAHERFGISKTGSNQGTVERLQRDGHVVTDKTTRTGWRVVDPLLELWLSNGRIWPVPG